MTIKICMQALALGLLCSCNCDEFSFVPEIPEPLLYTVRGYNSSGGQGLIMDFNKGIEDSTFVLNTTVILKEGVDTVYSTLWETTRRVRISVSFDPLWCQPGGICQIGLEIKGDTTETRGAIQSLDGQFLDGDRDGTDGGDFDGIIDVIF